MTDAVVSTIGLGKYYGSFQALHDVNIEVQRGEVFGFLGPNGAGKTTTIRILLDFLRPTTGSVKIFGQDPITHGVKIRRRIGYLAGDFVANKRQTGLQLLTALARLRGEVPTQRIETLAERLGLALDRRIDDLSKGNRQKVGLIQAFMHNPDLLILDEPTSGLDPLMQRTFLEMVMEAKTAGSTVFMSSHVLSEVQHAADRAALINGGRMVGVEAVETLRNKAPRQVQVRFNQPIAADVFALLPGVKDVRADGATIRFYLEGNADTLVKALAQHSVEDVLIEEPNLEDIFMKYFEGDQ